MNLPYAVALASGTAGLHLALEVLGVAAGDEVWSSTLTFAATAFAVRYVGATPVFVDSDPVSWNMDAAPLRDELDRGLAARRSPKALIVVDLDGDALDLEPIVEQRVSATWRSGSSSKMSRGARRDLPRKPPGALADLTILSFNGTRSSRPPAAACYSGHRKHWIRSRALPGDASTRTCGHDQHVDVGYNYRLSNLLAAGGARSARGLPSPRRRAPGATNAAYRRELGDLPGWKFMIEAPDRMSTFWLTCATIGPRAPASRDGCDRRTGRRQYRGAAAW